VQRQPNVPAVTEGLRIETPVGADIIEIIAVHGYHPDSVEIEYHRFLRIRDRDVDALLEGIVKGCSRLDEPREELKLLIDRYYTQGLSN